MELVVVEKKAKPPPSVTRNATSNRTKVSVITLADRQRGGERAAIIITDDKTGAAPAEEWYLFDRQGKVGNCSCIV